MSTLTRRADEDVAALPLRESLRLPTELRKRRSIRVASYNVYNLFGEDAEKPKPADELDALAQMILNLNADVISFAEVGGLLALQSLFRERVNKKLDGNDTYDAIICLPGNDRRGINVALATRLSVRGKMSFSDREFERDGHAIKFSRDLLGVMIQASPDPSHSFLYFAGHLKSKIGGESAEEKRRLEASEIVNILSEGTFGGPFIEQALLLAGDLNDDPETPVIDTLKAAPLRDLFQDVMPNNTYPTALPKRKYPSTRLDYLFASDKLDKKMRNCTIHREDPADLASDHYPISAEMQLL